MGVFTDESGWIRGWAMSAILIGGTCLLFVGLGKVINLTEFITAQAKIEQLRADVQRVGDSLSEDVMGQVTEWNQTILSNQRWNTVPVIGWIVPDGWDDIQPIGVR